MARRKGNSLKKVFPMVKRGTQKIGSTVTGAVKSVAPTMKRGIVGIFNALKQGTNYTLAKTKKMIMRASKKSRKNRRRRRN